MSLLDSRVLEGLTLRAVGKADRIEDGLRARIFRPGHVPVGFHAVESEEDRALLGRHLSRQAQREQYQTVPGDVNQAALANPAVSQMLAPPEAQP